jgi:hypothetical protein
MRSTRPATEYKRAPADVPDAALVGPCDTSEQSVKVNGDLTDELTRTRAQRDECAGRMDGVRQWRGDAIKRAEGALPKPQ